MTYQPYWMETDDGQAVPVLPSAPGSYREDLLTWAAWLETHDCQVARTRVGNVVVSTVFLGVNHNYTDGPPLIYETMAFGAERHELGSARYSTRVEALAGHERIVALVRENLLKLPPNRRLI